MATYLFENVIPYVGRALGIYAELGGLTIEQFLNVLSINGTLVCTNLITGETFTALITPAAFEGFIPILSNLINVTSNAIIAAMQTVINGIIGNTTIGQMPMWVFMMTIGGTGAMIIRIVFHLFF